MTRTEMGRDMLKPLVRCIFFVFLFVSLTISLQYPIPLDKGDIPKNLRNLSPVVRQHAPKLKYGQMDSPTVSRKQYDNIKGMKANSSMPDPEGTITLEGHNAQEAIEAAHRREQKLDSDKTNFQGFMSKPDRQELKGTYAEELTRLKDAGKVTQAEYTALSEGVSKILMREKDIAKAVREIEKLLQDYPLTKGTDSGFGIRKANVAITGYSNGWVSGIVFNDKASADFRIPDTRLPSLVSRELRRYTLSNSKWFDRIHAMMVIATVGLYILLRYLSSKYPEEKHGVETTQSGQLDEYRRVLADRREALQYIKERQTGSSPIPLKKVQRKGWDPMTAVYALALMISLAFACGWTLYLHPTSGTPTTSLFTLLPWDDGKSR